MYRKAYILLLQCVIFYELSLGDPLVGANVRPANAEQFPFVVSIGNSSETHKIKHICTGALISDRHVLTAEHCLQDDHGHLLKFKDLHVLVGTHDLFKGGKRIEIASWITYEQWALKNEIKLMRYLLGNYDIAVIKLSSRVKDVKPGILSTLKDKQLVGTEIVMAGWGVSNTGRIPNTLQTSRVKVISNKQCNSNAQKFKQRTKIFDEVYVCTASTPYAFLEDGDSGGPLMTDKREIVGVNMATLPKESEEPNDYGYHPGQEHLVVNLHMSIEYFKSFIQDAQRTI